MQLIVQLLNYLKQAQQLKKSQVLFKGYSKQINKILTILRKAGIIYFFSIQDQNYSKDFDLKNVKLVHNLTENAFKFENKYKKGFLIALTYINNKPLFFNYRIINKYMTFKEIQQLKKKDHSNATYNQFLNFYVFSTNHGLCTMEEISQNKIGGRLLFVIYF